MEQVYIETAKVFKALSDPKRLKIIDMLSCGELCACKILEEFQIAQPTLSHDMRILVEAGLLSVRREGKNTYYSLIGEKTDSISQIIKSVFDRNTSCSCNQ